MNRPVQGLRTLAILSSRELARSFSPYVGQRRGRVSAVRRVLEQLLMGRTKVLVTCFFFSLLSIVLGVITLQGEPLGHHPTRSITSMLSVMTCLGFGAVSLSAASIADDWAVIGRETLWGIKAGTQILARFLAMAVPTVVMSVAIALIYVAWVGLEGTTFVTLPMLYCAGLFSLYGLSCLALGLTISSLVGGVRSAVYLLMLMMSLLVLLSDIPFVIEELGGVGNLFWLISYTMPSRYCAGAWAAGIDFTPLWSRGWTWTSAWLNIGLDFLYMVVLTVIYLVIAAIRVRREAPKHFS